MVQTSDVASREPSTRESRSGITRVERDGWIVQHRRERGVVRIGRADLILNVSIA
jgi:hypothetical protein